MFVMAISNRGRKGEIGTVTGDGTSIGLFAGYTKCEQCKQQLKIVIPITEARQLADKLGFRRKESLKVRLAKKLRKWTDSVIVQ